MPKKIIIYRRIDSSNTNLVEERIQKELKNYTGEVVIDANELEYISSAGLRIILKIKKEYPNTKIINCNQVVYDIFEMTGFTQMMDIEKAYEEISVDGCEIIGEGAYGIVYRIDQERIVKVYKNPNSIDDIIKERERAKKAFILGVPTAISYDIVKVGNLYGSVFEMLDAKSFAELLREGKTIHKLVKKSVQMLKQIHEIENINFDLPNKKEEAIEWAKDCKKYLPKEIGKKLLEMMEEIPERNTIIHGDFHVKNIMHLAEEDLLIDMETVSVGHPIFELACSYSIYEGFECLDPKNPEKFLGIPKEQCRKFIKLTFDYYFDELEEEEIEEIKKKAKIICYTRLLRRQIKHFGIDNEEAKASIDFCKNYLIENVLKVDNLYF
ncbi:MAG: phosphotransferase [Bacilli bacterium]|nr:phosphotransferase [Bacilli bacterium]